MLGHLRSKALDSFKTKLEQSLNNGEGFAASVRKWTQSSMLEFNKGSAGNRILIHSVSIVPCNMLVLELS